MTSIASRTTTVLNITGFHTCRLSDCLDSLLENAPFKSMESGVSKVVDKHCSDKYKHWQWLSTGFYFWTDSDHFAHKWGNLGYKNNYAIVECHITIEQERLLDLVGNVNDQVKFVQLMKKYVDRLNMALQNKNRDLFKGSPAICKVIQHFRDAKQFPYDAVKAMDKSYQVETNFTPTSTETATLITRQQLCLFEHAKECIGKKILVFPPRIAS